MITIKQFRENARLIVKEINTVIVDEDQNCFDSERSLLDPIELIVLPREKRFKDFNIIEIIEFLSSISNSEELKLWKLYNENGLFGIRSETTIKNALDIILTCINDIDEESTNLIDIISRKELNEEIDYLDDLIRLISIIK